MKIRQGLEISTQDFWYDLTDGGYINQFNICENKEDAYKIHDAICVIIEFQKSCEEQIEGFIQ